MITVDNRQVDPTIHDSRSFTEGVIYAGSTVLLWAGFDSGLVPSINEGDRVIFKWTEDGEQLRTLDYRIPKSFAPTPPTPPKGSSCYIVTMCFGRDSAEYKERILFRDKILRRYKIGERLVSFYYKVGGFLVARLGQNDVAKRLSRCILKTLLALVKQWNRRYKKSEPDNR